MGLRMTEPRRSGELNPVPLERETAAFSAVSSSSKLAARVFVPQNWSRSLVGWGLEGLVLSAATVRIRPVGRALGEGEER